MATPAVDSAIGTPFSSRAPSRGPSRSRKVRRTSADPVCAQCPACQRAAAQSASRGASSSRSSSKAPSIFDVINHKIDVWVDSTTPASSRRVSEDVPRTSCDKTEPTIAIRAPSRDNSRATSPLPNTVASKNHSRASSSTRSTSQNPSGSRRSSAIFDTINRKIDVWVDGNTSRRASIESSDIEHQQEKKTTCPVHGVVDAASDDDNVETRTSRREDAENHARLAPIQSVGDVDFDKLDQEIRPVQEARTSEERSRAVQELSPEAKKFWSLKNGNMWNLLGNTAGRSCGGI